MGRVNTSYRDDDTQAGDRLTSTNDKCTIHDPIITLYT